MSAVCTVPSVVRGGQRLGGARAHTDFILFVLGIAPGRRASEYVRFS